MEWTSEQLANRVSPLLYIRLSISAPCWRATEPGQSPLRATATENARERGAEDGAPRDVSDRY